MLLLLNVVSAKVGMSICGKLHHVCLYIQAHPPSYIVHLEAGKDDDEQAVWGSWETILVDGHLMGIHTSMINDKYVRYLTCWSCMCHSLVYGSCPISHRHLT